MSPRFQDSASAYRLHRSVTNEAEALSSAIWRVAAADLSLRCARVRLLDAGTGDGQVLKGVLEQLLRTHSQSVCEMLLKEYDFQHSEVLLHNLAPLLPAFPRLALFVINRAFRELSAFRLI